MRIKTYNSKNLKPCLMAFVFFLIVQIGELAGLAVGSTIIVDILFAGY
jgi:hypothetical protein